jgi:hypothetical protein
MNDSGIGTAALEAVREVMLRAATAAGLAPEDVTIDERPITGYFIGERIWNCVLLDGDRQVAAVHVTAVPPVHSAPGFGVFADELFARSVDATKATVSTGLRPWLGCVVPLPLFEAGADQPGSVAGVRTILDRLVATSALDAACLLNGASGVGDHALSLPAFTAALQARCLLFSAV